MNSSITIALILLLLIPNALTQAKSLTGATDDSSGPSTPATDSAAPTTGQSTQDPASTSAHTEYDPSPPTKKTCKGQDPQLVTFRLHQTQLYVSAKSTFMFDATYRCLFLQNGNLSTDEFFIASQGTDCIWSFKTHDGLYLSHNPSTNFVTLDNSPSVKTGFYLEPVQSWFQVRSASLQAYSWKISDIGRILISLEQPAKFVIELEPNSLQDKN